MSDVVNETYFQLLEMPEDWRGRWCEADECGCMGCANRSGRLQCSKEEWKIALQEIERRLEPEIEG